MAAEAISKLKEAEDKGDEIVRAATDKAREVLKNAEKEGEEQYNSIITLAKKTRAELLEAAKAEALRECEPIAENGRQEREKLLNKGGQAMTDTVSLIVGRIVG